MMDESFDTEYFIDLIRERPALWDPQSEHHSNKIIKQQFWDEIFCLMVDGYEQLSDREKKERSKELLRRWKSLRNSFTRELARQKAESKEGVTVTRKPYLYFEMLTFLRPETNNSITTVSVKQEPEEQEDSTEQEMLCSHVRKRRRTNAGDHLQMQNETSRDSSWLNSDRRDDDYDKLFLLSLLPHFNAIPENQKLMAKGEIIQVLAKYNDISSSHSRPPPKTPRQLRPNSHHPASSPGSFDDSSQDSNAY